MCIMVVWQTHNQGVYKVSKYGREMKNYNEGEIIGIVSEWDKKKYTRRISHCIEVFEKISEVEK